MKMILNEYRLMPWQKEAQDLVAKHMEDFFFGEGAALPPGTSRSRRSKPARFRRSRRRHRACRYRYSISQPFCSKPLQLVGRPLLSAGYRDSSHAVLKSGILLRDRSHTPAVGTDFDNRLGAMAVFTGATITRDLQVRCPSPDDAGRRRQGPDEAPETPLDEPRPPRVAGSTAATGPEGSIRRSVTVGKQTEG